jgi:transposase
MIHLTANTHILVAIAPADFRQGIDGLAAVCRHKLSVNPRLGTVFVFINRNKTMVRALSYDGTGFWLMTKRLSKGKFTSWSNSTNNIEPLIAKQLRQLLLNNDPLWEKTDPRYSIKNTTINTRFFILSDHNARQIDLQPALKLRMYCE